MNSKEIRVPLALLRKTAAPAAVQQVANTSLGDIGRGVSGGIRNLWDAANTGASAAAHHLERAGAPKFLSGAVHAAPTALAAYGGYRVLKGLGNWNRERVLRQQMQQQGGY